MAGSPGAGVPPVSAHRPHPCPSRWRTAHVLPLSYSILQFVAQVCSATGCWILAHSFYICKNQNQRLDNLLRVTQGKSTNRLPVTFLFNKPGGSRQDICHCSHCKEEEPEAHSNEGQNSTPSVASCRAKFSPQCHMPADPSTHPDQGCGILARSALQPPS